VGWWVGGLVDPAELRRRVMRFAGKLDVTV